MFLQGAYQKVVQKLNLSGDKPIYTQVVFIVLLAQNR